jgi:hypothetical protein
MKRSRIWSGVAKREKVAKRLRRRFLSEPRWLVTFWMILGRERPGGGQHQKEIA